MLRREGPYGQLRRNPALGAYPKKSPPLPPGEGLGEGKRSSESIEKTGSDSSHPNARPFPRRTGEGRLWDRL